ncbi:N-acetylmuramoyl-L-alanine amidase [Paenibacillus aquistagni]|uniref:N-acetylmuramoyl-L-alanine amidase n=1 Tax=Paenibacillus aquistagni TaxID=1852522 RepID=A0A1X7LWV0_9BACL|nr:N-acetylmuramoyl-L-alanine amidase [Paenibacillus aquistagni]SMG58180.1 Copper amine oxidase N-terminal domain-containing protein [Paenibacillus aquistagni]
MVIIQKGNKYTNSSSRDGHVPCCIVNHISAGSMGSMDNWFTSPSNDVSSAHFGVAKDGRIHQYVDIRRMAWANGLTATGTTQAPAKVVRDRSGINPNKYTISIEHEGVDGDLTEPQFSASVWLHRYIQQEVERIWGKTFELDNYNVIGHCHIDPIRKASCPGRKFPWGRLYSVLKEEQLDKVKVVVNGKIQKEGFLIDGVTYIPARVVAESLGASVAWDGNQKRVDIISK